MSKLLILTACSYLCAAPLLYAAPANVTSTAATGASATALLAQLSAAFSGGNVVHQVQLSGTVTWQAGTLHDTGSATLNASSSGSSQIQLSLVASGTRTEAQSGQGSDLGCTWTGKDGVAHDIDPGNCWRPMLWYLPAISIQPTLLPSYVGAVDLGTGTVGFGTATYRHLQSQLVLPNLKANLLSDIMQRSIADLGLDPVTFLPAVLAYSIRPDSGESIPIAIEIHYANYQTVNGVQIPFTIQRYINGSLQLEIAASSAQVN